MKENHNLSSKTRYIKTNDFLPGFFDLLHSKKIYYAVLRGHEQLPQFVINDLDIGLAPFQLDYFFLLLNNYSIPFKVNCDLVFTRLDVYKIIIHFKDNRKLKIDVWTGFNFLGLYYIDLDQALISRIKKCGFYKIQPNYEVAISLLKELLHNSITREDKKPKLQELFDHGQFNVPFLKYCSNKIIIKRLKTALFYRNTYFPLLGLSIRLELIKGNIKALGLLKTINNMYLFFKNKYL